MFDSIDEGFFLIDVIFDEDGRPEDLLYVEANAAATAMLGRDFTGLRLNEVEPGYEPYGYEIFGEVARSGKSVRAEQYAAPDRRWYDFCVFRIGGHDSRRIASIFKDITQRKRAEEALRESEMQFRCMADGSPFLIWVTDAACSLQFVNSTYCRFFGVSEEEVLGPNWMPLVHPEDEARYVAEFAAATAERRPFRCEARVRTADGTWRWIASVGSPRFSATGAFLGMVGSSPDITEQKVADEELRALYAEQRRVALTLQQHFVHPLPDVEGVELAAVSEAASEAGLIGGDFHDVFLLPEGRIVVLLGDVEGKGVAAAGLTETVRSAVRALSLVSSAPAEILDLVNRLLLAEPSEQHVTALLAVVDPASGAGTFASAAHPAPLHLSPDGCEYLEPVYGLPLGTFDLPYEEQPLRLASGDTLLLYTDGLTEARRRGQFFGPERLLSEARRSSMRPPLELVKGLKESVTAFADEVRDDIEILALHYCPRAEAFGRSAAASVPYEVEAQSS